MWWLFLGRPVMIIMSSRRSPAATGFMKNSSVGKHLTGTFLTFIVLSFLIQNCYGADSSTLNSDLSEENDDSTAGSDDPSFSPTVLQEPAAPAPLQPISSTRPVPKPRRRRSLGDLQGPPAPPGFPRRYSLPALYPHQYSLPAEAPTERHFAGEKEYELPTKKTGIFHKAYTKFRHYRSKFGTGLRKAWEALKAKMRKAKEAAKRGVARVFSRLPKFRKRRSTEPWYFMGAPSAATYELTSEDKADLIRAPQGCEQWLELLPPPLREAWRTYPSFCAIWILFDRDGLLSAKKPEMLQLAGKLAERLNQDVEPDRDTANLLLAMDKDFAAGQDKLAQTRFNVDKYCWFTDVTQIYRRATPREKDRILGDRSLTTIKANPCKMLLKAPRLWEKAKEDMDNCMQASEEEREARLHTLRVFSKQIKAFSEESKVGEGEPRDESDLAKMQVRRELILLQGREKCSMSELLITQEHIIKMWDYMKERNKRSFLTRWALKTAICQRQDKNASFLPTYFTEPCKEYLQTPPPTSSKQVDPNLQWLWEAGDTREAPQE